ncbi:MAG: UvrD-helicase domain-containing protein, partial [Candidatus Rokubacteria bacterium]|nr:UvrD-helicase domain-containing protein [Candidatus Rokubacteria bacterium]
YQETNRLQVLLLKEIAAPRFELCAVGDDGLSIYRFSGASVKSLLRFEEDFPGRPADRPGRELPGEAAARGGGLGAHRPGRPA